MGKKTLFLLAAICATAAVTAAPLLGAADAKLPCPCPGQGHKHHQKTKSVVGQYKGTTEEDGTVSFRLTRGAKIVGFTLTNAKLFCLGPHSGSKIPTREPEFTKIIDTITHGPIRMKGKSKKYPQGKEFDIGGPGPENVARQAGHFTGKVEVLTSGPTGGVTLPDKGFHGEVEFETANGPTPFPSSQNPMPEWAPGTEWCVTKAIDWHAKKPGTPGFPPPEGPPPF